MSVPLQAEFSVNSAFPISVINLSLRYAPRGDERPSSRLFQQHGDREVPFVISGFRHGVNEVVFWDVTQPRLVVTDVSGQPVVPIIGVQAVPGILFDS
jgi:hypothetical protein